MSGDTSNSYSFFFKKKKEAFSLFLSPWPPPSVFPQSQTSELSPNRSEDFKQHIPLF